MGECEGELNDILLVGIWDVFDVLNDILLVGIWDVSDVLNKQLWRVGILYMSDVLNAIVLGNNTN